MIKLKKCKQLNPSLLAGLTIIIVISVLAFIPGAFTHYNPTDIASDSILKAPSDLHLFGTDNFGRDIFSRVIYATRIDVMIGIFSVLIPFIIGTTLGLISGYYGGKIDSLIMRTVDIFMAFPYMVLAIAIVAIEQAGLWALFLSMWLVSWKEYARLIRSEVLVVKNAEYVEAAKVLAYSDFRIITRSILPNVLSSAIIYAASDVVMCMLSGAAMSYLGLGVQAPTPEWGAIISGGKAFLSTAWWITIFPGIFLVVTGFGFSLIGDGLSDILRKGRA
ncbi:MAG: glutathione transport system permease protein GsiD [Firmicutes bacterium]|nr:glutathione transport system permease protein GsiD [Bacillota bacterium]